MNFILFLRPCLFLLLFSNITIIYCFDDNSDVVDHTYLTSNLTGTLNGEQSQNQLENSNKFQVVTDLKSREFEFDVLDDTQESGDAGNQNQPKSNPTDGLELLRHKSGYSYLCLFKPGVKCTEFRYQGETVWKRDPSLLDEYYPYSIYFKPLSRELTVWLNWKWYYLYSYSDVHNSYVLKYSRTDGKSDGVPTPKFSSSETSQVPSLESSFQTSPPKPTDDEQTKDSAPAPETKELDSDQQEPSLTEVEDGSVPEASESSKTAEESKESVTSKDDSSSQPASTGAGFDSGAESSKEESDESPTSGSAQPEDQHQSLPESSTTAGSPVDPTQSGESESSTDGSQPTSVSQDSVTTPAEAGDQDSSSTAASGDQETKDWTQDSTEDQAGEGQPKAEGSAYQKDSSESTSPTSVPEASESSKTAEESKESVTSKDDSSSQPASTGAGFDSGAESSKEESDESPTSGSAQPESFSPGSGTVVEGTSGSDASPSSPEETGDHEPEKEPEAVSLDIKNKKDCDQYTYTYDSKAKIATFQAKSEFVFNLVKQGQDKIWETQDISEYSNKVVTDGEGPGSKKVSIYLLNETIKNFNKKDKKSPWTEMTDFMELNIKDTKTTYEFDFQKDDPSKTNTYTTKHGFKFSSVKENKTEVWKSSDPEEYSDNVEVKVDGSKPKFITVYLKDGTPKSFIKLGDKWFETPVSVEVDTKKSSNTDAFNVNKENKVNTYTSKNGVKFNLVKYDKTEIWKASGDCEHSNKVEFKDLGSNKADLTVHLNDGSTKKFHRPGKSNPWTEVTSSQQENEDDQTSTSLKESKDSTLSAGRDSTNESSEVSKSTPSSGSSTPETKTESESSQSEGSSQDSSETKPAKPTSSSPDSSTPSSHATPKAGQGSQDSSITSDPVFQSSGATPTSGTSVEHPSDFSITTEGSSSENDRTKYELKKYGDIYKFMFKDGVKCKEIKYKSNQVWEFDVSFGKILKEIYFNSSTRICFYSFCKTKFIPFFTDDDWKTDSGSDKKLSASKFKVLTQGSDGTTKENETSHYEEKNDGSFVKCEFKDGAKLTELKHDNASVWKFDQSKHGTNHPKALYFHKHLKVVFVVFDNEAFIFVWFDSDTESWRYVNIEKMENLDTNKFNALTPDPNDSDKDKENDTDVFDKKVIGSVVGFVLKNVPNYLRARYDEELIFSFNKGSGKQPALKEMYFMGHSKKVLLWLEDKCYYANYDAFESVS